MRLINAEKLIANEKAFAEKYKGDFGEQVAIHTIEILEQAQTIESIPLEFIMQHIESHGLYTSAMEVVSAWREGQMENEFDRLNEETKQAIKDSFEHPERGERYESFEEFKEAINQL